jgi:ABC-type transport system substrate-binding protein
MTRTLGSSAETPDSQRCPGPAGLGIPGRSQQGGTRRQARRPTPRSPFFHLAVTAAACFAAWSAPAQAQRTLTVLPVAAPTSMDPHFEDHPLNHGPQRPVYDTLLTLDSRAVLRPYLAEAWRQLDDRTWEFRLREGVRFHDGTPFGAEDVAFSIARAAAVTGGPGSYAARVRGVAAVEVAEPRTLLVRTREPDPFLDFSLIRAPGDCFGAWWIPARNRDW